MTLFRGGGTDPVSTLDDREGAFRQMLTWHYFHQVLSISCILMVTIDHRGVKYCRKMMTSSTTTTLY